MSAKKKVVFRFDNRSIVRDAEKLQAASSLAAPLCSVHGASNVHIRIYTRCPACHNDTLIINKGRLLCTWHVCPDPTLIDRLGEVAPNVRVSDRPE